MSELKNGREVRNFRGTRDFFGDDARWRNWVITQIQEVFESFGFEPLETPVVENEETLSGKYGEEGEMKRFKLSLKYPEAAGLRYDHTVPLARFMAMNWNQFPLPYRRYIIGPVFRNETVQAGRYRQFTQCDFDTVGSTSPVIDAEVVAMNYAVLTRLGFTDNILIRVNDRRLLNAMAKATGFTDNEQVLAVFRSWDKLEKTSRAKIRSELSEAGVDKDLVANFDSVTDELMRVAGEPADVVLSKILATFPSDESVAEAVDRLDELFGFISAMQVSDGYYELWPLLARGLDYYTGPIFETVVETADIGSITGGGRFDNLIAEMGGPDMAACGSSFGLERVMGVMEELGLRPESAQTTQVFVTLFDPEDRELCQASFEAASQLRLTGYRVEVYTGEAQKLGKQLDIANRKGIPLVTILGPDELRQEQITIKDLRPSEDTEGPKQVTIPVSRLTEQVEAMLPVD